MLPEKRNHILSASVIAGILLLYLIPIQIPRSVRGGGMYVPAREWTLIRDADGSLLSSIQNYQYGYIDNYKSIKVNRGDVLQCILDPHIFKKNNIISGDTIAHISSRDIHDRLLKLDIEMDEAKARLAVTRSGDKEDLVAMARARYAAAKKRAGHETRIAARDDSLYQRRLISKEAFESSLTSADIAALEESAALAGLKAAESGDKPEHLQLIQSQILGIEHQIFAHRCRLEDFVIQSPFDGTLRRTSVSDTVAVIESWERILVCYLDIRHLPDVHPGQTVRFSTPAFKPDITGTIDRIDQKLHVQQQAQVFSVTAVLNTTLPHQISHACGTVTIHTGKQTIRQWIHHFVHYLAAGQ